jgi:hypothetical protein
MERRAFFVKPTGKNSAGSTGHLENKKLILIKEK